MARAKAKTSARRAPRRSATKRPAGRKTRNATRMRAKASPPQRFVVSHHREDDFESGLRRYAKYRDLGIVKATNGMVRAHVIRFVPPCRPEEVSKRHYHDVDFQMVYVLKGWITRVNPSLPSRRSIRDSADAKSAGRDNTRHHSAAFFVSSTASSAPR